MSSSSRVASSRGLALATSMVTGTWFLLSLFRENRKFPPEDGVLLPQIEHSGSSNPPSCLSGANGGERVKKEKKKVRFADDVKVESTGGNRGHEHVRRIQREVDLDQENLIKITSPNQNHPENKRTLANRVARCGGILKDRLCRFDSSLLVTYF